MKCILPVFFALAATAAGAHEGAHLHPHESNGWALGIFLLGLGLAAGYLLGKVHK